jgi:sodium/pantothenate symporter
VNPPEIIFFLNLFAFGGLECTFFWPLVGGLFWKRGNGKGAVASAIGATATYIFCYYNVSVAGLSAVIWGLLAGGILYFAVGRLTRPDVPDPELLDRCF